MQATINPVALAQQTSQNNPGLQLAGTKSFTNMNPGECRQFKIDVKSLANTRTGYSVSYDNFKAGVEEGGAPELLNDKDFKFGLSKYITGEDIFTLESNEKAAYSFTVSIPQNIVPGTYFALVRFTAPKDAQGLAPSVASLVFVNVGNPEAMLATEEFNNSKFITDNTGKIPRDVFARVRNDSNKYLVPSVIIDIIDSKQNTVTTIDLNTDQAGILPQSIRKFSKSSETLEPLKPNQAYTPKLSIKNVESANSPTSNSSTTACATPAVVAANSSSGQKKKNYILVASGIVVAGSAIAVAYFLTKRRKKVSGLTAEAPVVPVATSPTLTPLAPEIKPPSPESNDGNPALGQPQVIEPTQNNEQN